MDLAKLFDSIKLHEADEAKVIELMDTFVLKLDGASDLQISDYLASLKSKDDNAGNVRKEENSRNDNLYQLNKTKFLRYC